MCVHEGGSKMKFKGVRFLVKGSWCCNGFKECEAEKDQDDRVDFDHIRSEVVDLPRLILREAVSQPLCLWEVLLDTSS